MAGHGGSCGPAQEVGPHSGDTAELSDNSKDQGFNSGPREEASEMLEGFQAAHFALGGIRVDYKGQGTT